MPAAGKVKNKISSAFGNLMFVANRRVTALLFRFSLPIESGGRL